MSGVEIAGLVLGAFPLIFMAIEYYQRGCGPLGDWWRFKPMMRKLKLEAEVQETLLRQNLEILFRAVLDSEEDAKNLCGDLSASLHRDPHIAAKVKDWLRESYDVFLGVFVEMKEAIEKVKEVFDIRNSTVERMKLETNWTYQMKRIKIPLKKKVVVGYLQTINDGNERLSRLLNNTSQLAPVRERRRSSKAVIALDKVRESASNLYEALGRCWNCQHNHHHAAGLALAPTVLTDGGPICFNVSFSQHGSIWYDTMIESTVNEEDMQGDLLANSHKQVQWSKIGVTDAIECIQQQMPELTPQQTPNHVMKRSKHRMIQNLCHAINSHELQATLGCIPANSGYRHLVTMVGTAAKGRTMLQLCQMFNPAAGTTRLSRGRRMHLAVRCAESLLQLYETPWINGGITSDTVLFLHNKSIDTSLPPIQNSNHPGTLSTSSSIKPLFVANFSDITRQLQDSSVETYQNYNLENTRLALLKLGILLMELCYGELISNSPIRQKYLVGGQEHDFTTVATAYEWHRGVVGEAGDQYSGVVERCIHCNFGIVKPSFHDAEFRQAVYDNVVLPLRAIAEQFC